jgi:hypothetical protein
LDAVKTSPKLRKLHIPHISEGSAEAATLLDDAIFDCLRSDSQLEELTVSGNLSPRALAGLVDAINHNYTLKRLKLRSIPQHRSCQKAINIITRLNAAGRQYTKIDPGNKIAGVDVLISVSDTLDCLFYHLVENPSLCAGIVQGDSGVGIEPSRLQATRKRKLAEL